MDVHTPRRSPLMGWTMGTLSPWGRGNTNPLEHSGRFSRHWKLFLETSHCTPSPLLQSNERFKALCSQFAFPDAR